MKITTPPVPFAKLKCFGCDKTRMLYKWFRGENCLPCILHDLQGIAELWFFYLGQRARTLAVKRRRKAVAGKKRDGRRFNQRPTKARQPFKHPAPWLLKGQKAEGIPGTQEELAAALATNGSENVA